MIFHPLLEATGTLTGTSPDIPSSTDATRRWSPIKSSIPFAVACRAFTPSFLTLHIIPTPTRTLALIDLGFAPFSDPRYVLQ